MVVRLVLLMLVAWCRGVHLFTENPLSTLIHFFSPLRELIESIMPHKVTIFLSSYGSLCPKPIFVWSTTSLVQQLKLPKKATTERLAVKKHGSVTGRKDALKSSQAYPAAFGQAVSGIYQQLQQARSLGDLLEEDGTAILAAALMSGPLAKRRRL